MQASPTASYEAVEVIGGIARRVRMNVVRDRMVDIYVNGVRAASVTAMPECLESLAVGYVIGEGIAPAAGHIRSIEVADGKVYVTLRPPAGADPVIAGPHEPLDIRSLFYNVLRSAELAPAIQAEYAHFSIIFSAAGGMIAYARDADRHGALWKAVGKGLSPGVGVDDAVVICSGSVDSTMVRAAARAGIRAIVSPVSPTDRAVESARDAGLVLMRFDGLAKACIYCGEGSLSGMEFFKDRPVEPAAESNEYQFRFA